MGIKAEVTHFLNNFTAEAEFSETAVSFYGSAWEISFLFGLLPIRGKTKELLRIEYSDIEQVTVGKSAHLIGKKDICTIKLKNQTAKNNYGIEVAFTPFESGREMLYRYVGDRFV